MFRIFIYPNDSPSQISFKLNSILKEFNSLTTSFSEVILVTVYTNSLDFSQFKLLTNNKPKNLDVIYEIFREQRVPISRIVTHYEQGTYNIGSIQVSIYDINTEKLLNPFSKIQLPSLKKNELSYLKIEPITYKKSELKTTKLAPNESPYTNPVSTFSATFTDPNGKIFVEKFSLNLKYDFKTEKFTIDNGITGEYHYPYAIDILSGVKLTDLKAVSTINMGNQGEEYIFKKLQNSISATIKLDEKHASKLVLELNHTAQLGKAPQYKGKIGGQYNWQGNNKYTLEANVGGTFQPSESPAFNGEIKLKILFNNKRKK